MNVDSAQPLFGSLHPDTFRPLTGKNRAFYEGLLEYLSKDVFSDGIMIPRSAVIDAIRHHMLSAAFEPEEDETSTTRDAVRIRDEGPAYLSYYRLQETGWLVEHKDGYKRLVDLDSSPRLLLDALLDIKSGKLRSYGGEVLQVEALLTVARHDPGERSEAIASAARSSKSFLGHLRAVGAAMRKAEEAILQQRSFGEFFRRVFDDFVSTHLIEDFTRLHTQQNPFRFRMRILQMAEAMGDDDPLLRTLGESYAREGRAADADHGIEMAAADLRTVQAVFRDIDIYLGIIEDTSTRVERRLSNTVRYMERIAESDTEGLMEAFRALAQAPITGDAMLPVSPNVLTSRLPLGGENLYLPVARSAPVGPQMMNRSQPDPAFVAFRKAQIAYQQRTLVTPVRVLEYLNRTMDGRQEIRASELPCETLDDFFVFEQLRALELFEGGIFAARYQITPVAGRVDNGWLALDDFVISRRVETADGTA